MKNIFLIGLNEFNLKKLESLENAEDYVFHGLLDYHEVADPEVYNVRELIQKAENQLKQFSGSIDAIVGYMDFPVSTMVPVLCNKFGVRSSSVESFIKCEHKYWSRLEQKKSIPEHIPDFYLFDPWAESPLASIALDFPFWIKPVKSFGSHLGFKIHNKNELDKALEVIRENISRIAAPFNDLLNYLDLNLPPALQQAEAHFCLAEGFIGGRQCTLEGCVYNGKPYFHGVVDSIRYPHKSVFFRYQYPSQLPRKVQERMKSIASRFLKQIDYNNSPFNMEFFWDEKRDKIWFLEINTRVAQHHSDLFHKVDGVTNHQVPVDLALDRPPVIPERKGKFKTAAAFFYREFKDAIVEKVPGSSTIQKLEASMPGTIIQVDVQEGMQLTQIPEQDAYSFICALIYLGGSNQQELIRKYHECLQELEFRFRPVPEQPPFAGAQVRPDGEGG